MRKCDLCGSRPAELTDRTVINNGVLEYHFCEECYRSIHASGLSVFAFMQEIAARKGKKCLVCGATAEDFRRNFFFGCPECYKYMREIALSAANSSQQAIMHRGKRPPDGGSI